MSVKLNFWILRTNVFNHLRIRRTPFWEGKFGYELCALYARLYGMLYMILNILTSFWPKKWRLGMFFLKEFRCPHKANQHWLISQWNQRSDYGKKKYLCLFVEKLCFQFFSVTFINEKSWKNRYKCFWIWFFSYEIENFLKLS